MSTIKTLYRHRKHERGFVLVLTAISMFALMLLVGFGVDLGSWYLNASKLQRAADAATLAAAAQLPVTSTAQAAATQSFQLNGYQSGVNGIKITTTISGGGISSSITDAAVPVYFLKMVMPHMTIARVAYSTSSPVPILGSPFNVLGSGNLTLPNASTSGASGNAAPQNYWLAVNGICSPKEDGDYFTARYDHNKGPFTKTTDSHNNYIPSSAARTNCPGNPTTETLYPQNTDYEGQGYSYFIDVPKPPPGASAPSVSIEIYDPAMSEKSPDYDDTMPADNVLAWGNFAFDVFNTEGTPENPNDDQEMLPLGHPYALYANDVRTPQGKWWKILTLSGADISNGGQFRVQAIPLEDYPNADWGRPDFEGANRGVDSFSIGAFASWETPNSTESVCDSDNDIYCPRTYGLNAMSVFNNISGGNTGGTADFYLADITPQYIGTTFDVMLWDPGEGTQGIELVSPTGALLPFTYTSGYSTPTDIGPSSSTPTTNLSLNGPSDGHEFDPTSGLPTLSNAYLFNDRLVTLQVTIPSNYVGSGNDNWLRLRYVVNSTSPNDRTTWGVVIPGGASGGPVHLTPPVP